MSNVNVPDPLESSSQAQVKEHPVADYEKLMSGDVQLVDVREPEEVAAGSLPGAMHIPLGDIPSRMSELDGSKPTLLLCRSGGRSGKAAEFLAQNGYDVTNLTGGMLAWDAR